MRNLAPERLRGQGVDGHQAASANRAILHLLQDPTARIAGRPRARRGGTTPTAGPTRCGRSEGSCGSGGASTTTAPSPTRCVEVVGENPVADQDPLALATVALERAAASAGGFRPRRPGPPLHRPGAAAATCSPTSASPSSSTRPTRPTSPCRPRTGARAPSPAPTAPCTCGQARAPLWFSGPGIRPGTTPWPLRSVDIAPTCLAALDFPLIDGRRRHRPAVVGAGRRRPTSTWLARTAPPSTPCSTASGPRPTRLYVFLLDGLHQTELEDRLAGTRRRCRTCGGCGSGPRWSTAGRS